MKFPVYLFTGFLESGKTTFIKEILKDEEFVTNENSLLILCEEGVEELEKSDTTVLIINSEDELTPELIRIQIEKCKADRYLLNLMECGISIIYMIQFFQKNAKLLKLYVR
ncbi:hypothetical protein [Clostridium butyricum]|uniref:hypothetical protein n=1 Tax=Clostridium butyricum TaxID=1492 RepID=UPI000AEA8DF9|nr:hypothetical protein [Clostridium butyricum]